MFSNPVVGGTTLVRPAIQSPNFVAGTSGWTINADGSAEFNNVTIRGTLSVASITGDVTILAPGRLILGATKPQVILSNTGQIIFDTGHAQQTNLGSMSCATQNVNPNSQAYIAITTPMLSGTGNTSLNLFSAAQGGLGVGHAVAYFFFDLLGSPSIQFDYRGVLSAADVSVNQLQSMYFRGWGDTNHRIVVPAVAPTYATNFNVDGPMVIGFNQWLLCTGNNGHWQACVFANGLQVFGNLGVNGGSSNDLITDFESITTGGGSSGISMRQRGRGMNDPANRIVVYPGNAGANGGEGMYLWSNGDMVHLGWGQNFHIPMGVPALGGGLTMTIIAASQQVGVIPSGAAFKKDVQHLGASAENPLWAMIPRRFRWKETLSNHEIANGVAPNGVAGLIAEEVYAVAPDAARLEENGYPATLDIHALLGYIVDAIHHLREKVDSEWNSPSKNS